MHRHRAHGRLAFALATAIGLLVLNAAPALGARSATVHEASDLAAASERHPAVARLVRSGRPLAWLSAMISEPDQRFALIRLTSATGPGGRYREFFVALTRQGAGTRSWRALVFGRRLDCRGLPPAVRVDLRPPCRRLSGPAPTRAEIRRAILESPVVPEEMRDFVREEGATALSAPRYHDLTRDGAPEALVFTTLGATGAAWGYVVVGRADGRVAVLRAGSPSFQVSVTARRGLLIERHPVFRLGDPVCCPGAIRERRLIWRHGRFVPLA